MTDAATAAWQAYEAAYLHAHAMMTDPIFTSAERCAAHARAARLHRAFANLICGADAAPAPEEAAR